MSNKVREKDYWGSKVDLINECLDKLKRETPLNRFKISTTENKLRKSVWRSTKNKDVKTFKFGITKESKFI